MLCIPTGISESPISSTTMPETTGAKTRRSRVRDRLNTISTGASASDIPIMRGIPPSSPAWISGATKEKLVPCTLRSPEPITPTARAARRAG